MPGGDRTGPLGRGPMTGRAAGRCSGFSGPGYANPDVPRYGRGFGFGRGRGRGFGRGFWGRRYYYDEPYPSETPVEQTTDQEKAYLESTIKSLEAELKSVQRRLQELSKAKKEEP